MKMLLILAASFIVVTITIYVAYPSQRIPAIEGSYIRFAEHEFGKEWDTLVIIKLSDHYRVTRRWNYERILDGEALTPEYKIEVSTASYLRKEDLFVEEESGLRYRYDGGKLKVGSTIYQKIR